MESFLELHRENGQSVVNYQCKSCILKFAKQVIQYLEYKHFLTIDDVRDRVLPTPLGKATFASHLSPEEASMLF